MKALELRMRGWSCKAASAVLGISDTKVTQSLYARGAAFDKVARLMLSDPLRTWVDLLVHMTKHARSDGVVSEADLADTAAQILALPSPEARQACCTRSAISSTH